MANHARSLRAISFLGNKSVSLPLQRPSNNLVALERVVVETHLLKIGLDSSRGDGDRIGYHHQTHWAGLHQVSDEDSGPAASWHQPRTLEPVRPLLTRGRRRRRQSQAER